MASTDSRLIDDLKTLLPSWQRHLRAANLSPRTITPRDQPSELLPLRRLRGRSRRSVNLRDSQRLGRCNDDWNLPDHGGGHCKLAFLTGPAPSSREPRDRCSFCHPRPRPAASAGTGTDELRKTTLSTRSQCSESAACQWCRRSSSPDHGDLELLFET